MRAPYSRTDHATLALVFLALALAAQLSIAQTDDDPWIGPDKALHFSVSAGIAGATYFGAMFLTEDVRLRVALSAGVALLAGTGKELADLAGILGHPSWRDFAWDVIGTFSGVLTALLIDQLVISPLAAQIPVW